MPLAVTTTTPPVTLPMQPVAPVGGDPIHEVKWAELVARFDEARLHRHLWDWAVKEKDWLPIYRYQPVSDISDIWTEWSVGVDGFLPVRDLVDRWGARWRRNDPGQRTESSRRMKVVNLINELASKHRWDVSLALRFLRERYEHQFKARSFCDYLTWENKDKVLQAAMGYPS